MNVVRLPTQPRLRSLLAGSAIIALLVGVAGCHKRSNAIEVHPVCGVVTLDGKPVEDALVVFCPQSPALPAAIGKTDGEGRFKLTTTIANDGAAIGAYCVTVTKKTVNGMTRKEANEYMERHHQPPPLPAIVHHLPKKYADAAETPFRIEVNANTTDVDLAMKQ
jgi:hypothetical protein